MPRMRLTSSGDLVAADAPRRDDRRRHLDPKRSWRSTFAWQQLRRAQIAREPRCRRCGATSRLTADHIVPVAAGGAWDDPENLQTLCLRCNSSKGARL